MAHQGVLWNLILNNIVNFPKYNKIEYQLIILSCLSFVFRNRIIVCSTGFNVSLIIHLILKFI